MMQGYTSALNSSNGTEGLNPQFVNVDHELETPSGEEGPVPAYALPDVPFNATLPQADEDPNVAGIALKYL